MPAELHGKAPEFHNEDWITKVQRDCTLTVSACIRLRQILSMLSTLKESGLEVAFWIFLDEIREY